MTHETQIILHIVVICVIGVVTNAILQRGLRALRQRDIFSFGATAIMAKICRWTIIVITGLLAVNEFGISVHALWTSLSAVLVLVAVGFIAVWSILSNISSALLLVLFAPFRIGDEIEVIEPSIDDPLKTGLKGTVIDISFLYTTLAEDAKQEVLVRIPNNIFFQKAIRRRKGKKTESLQQNLFHRAPD